MSKNHNVVDLDIGKGKISNMRILITAVCIRFQLLYSTAALVWILFLWIYIHIYYSYYDSERVLSFHAATTAINVCVYVCDCKIVLSKNATTDFDCPFRDNRSNDIIVQSSISAFCSTEIQ